MSIGVLLGKQLARAIKGTGDDVADETVEALGKTSAIDTPSVSLKEVGYRIDNPSDTWAKGKQKSAERVAEESDEGTSTKKLLSGSQTGFLGTNKNTMFLDTNFVASIKGANDEIPAAGQSKYDDLMRSVSKSGFDTDQKGNKIMIGVNHKGDAFIMEGNNRTRIALEQGVPAVKVEVKYFNGAEEVDGPYSPDNIIKNAVPADTIFKRKTAAENIRSLVQRPTKNKSFIEAYEGRNVIPKVLNKKGTQVDPDYVYRTMSRKEYDSINKKGKLTNTSMYGRIHASASPLSEFSNKVDDTVTVKIKYSREDGWKAKTGADEIYAVTDQDIPASRIELVE